MLSIAVPLQISIFTCIGIGIGSGTVVPGNLQGTWTCVLFLETIIPASYFSYIIFHNNSL